jgi:hypothetical protein
MDGRDALLRDIVYASSARHETAEAIAKDAWSTFSLTADLARPKRDGSEPWSYEDALKKARELLARGKPRPLPLAPPAASDPAWVAQSQRFAHTVDRACITGELSRTDVLISDAMLAFVQGPNGACFASCETIAAHVGCRPATVKKARRQLRQHHLWRATHTAGGRGLLAFYIPCLSIVEDEHVDTSLLGAL